MAGADENECRSQLLQLIIRSVALANVIRGSALPQLSVQTRC